jgi:hypothetical protein
MMIVMKFFCLLLLAASAAMAQLSDVHSVYLLPMAGGLDQYLAVRLTGAHALPVVTDPKLADAVLTDHLGAGFEEQLKGMRGPIEKVDGGKPPLSTFGRGHGNVFLVDVKSRQVLWSAYEKPRGSSPEALQRTAKRVVADLEKALGSRTKPPA